VDEDFVLGQFGRHKTLARRKYREFVMERLDGEHEGKYYEVKDQRYLGEESFIDRIEGQKGEAENSVYDVPIEVIAREVSKATGITQESLYSLTRSREGARGRSIVAYLARVVSGWMIKDVGRHFRRSPMVMSQACIKIEGQLRKDLEFREMIEKLKMDLTQKAKKKYLITIA